MRPSRLLLTVAIVLTAFPFSQAQTANLTESNEKNQTVTPVPLIFWNRQITTFRSYYENTSPAERVARAIDRLDALPAVSSEWLVDAKEATTGQYSGALVTVNGQFVFGILSSDVDQESGETLKSVVDHAKIELRSALEARTQQRRLPALLRSIAATLVATFLLIAGLLLTVRIAHSLLARLQGVSPSSRPWKIAGFDVRPFLTNLNRLLVILVGWALAVFLIYIWLAFVLLRFPYSAPWGQQLGGFLTDLLTRLGKGFLGSIPGVFTVVVIFLFTRILARIVDRFFYEVELGRLKSAWLHSDTARATRRLVVFLVWIFAITVAYPYIPGSSSDAFKGVSVFVGLMISLGSAGLVNQLMSGLVVIYSRALRAGEFVRIGDHLGTVTDVGMLSTKIITPKREEITIPNAVLVGKETVNYSRQASTRGSMLGTKVTIGYDAPWRLVHSMLLHAAAQTDGIRKEPTPRVWQLALSDFYVEYELVFHLDRPSDRIPILSTLHERIQDAFNEQGVQIMSPHFKAQPAEKVYVPQSEWDPQTGYEKDEKVG